ncbi:hypothetical protein GIW81_18105 [Hyphomicrobium sp. xq]|uniref:Uncharacterized protein n=1 Tax=Hyphomicrobium album TaxID=2665159 RepID=A0A6I3KRI8_9HYPH|nr:hypothetical protein [Hyphomicrobium album]MTD96257.1 hypothetical protein [Hyphomicrobium album]
MPIDLRIAHLPALTAALFFGFISIVPTFAQEKGKVEVPKAAAKQKDAAPAAAKPAAVSQPMPDGAALNILIRRTLLTVNDANMSGNYSVLRDLAAPGFQQENDVKKLAEIFAALRNSKIDFAPIVYFDPKLVRQPEFIKEGRLRLTGFMPTKPQQVNFDMLFENIAGTWRLYGIAVNTSAQSKTSSADPAKAPPAAAPAKK